MCILSIHQNLSLVRSRIVGRHCRKGKGRCVYNIHEHTCGASRCEGHRKHGLYISRLEFERRAAYETGVRAYIILASNTSAPSVSDLRQIFPGTEVAQSNECRYGP